MAPSLLRPVCLNLLINSDRLTVAWGAPGEWRGRGVEGEGQRGEGTRGGGVERRGVEGRVEHADEQGQGVGSQVTNLVPKIMISLEKNINAWFKDIVWF